MADEIQISTKLFANKGGASVASVTESATLDMTGTHMAEATQAIGFAADEILDVPGDVTGDRLLEVKNLEAEGGNFVQLSLGTGGAFAAGVWCKLNGGMTSLVNVPSAVNVYAKADTASVNIKWRIVQN